MRHPAERDAATWGHFCYNQMPTTLPASTPRCPQCGALDLSRARVIPPDVTDEPLVCIAHGRFIPCRKDGEHRYTSNPYWAKAVRDYQSSPIEDLTWEPAWEGNDEED